MQISYYDISRGVYDLAGRVKVTGTMGVPLCLSSAVGEKTEQENVIYGDDSGAAILLQCGRGELPARVLKPGDFTYVHDDHSDWVTQVCNALCRATHYCADQGSFWTHDKPSNMKLFGSHTWCQ